MKVKLEKVNPICEPTMYKLVNESGEVLAFPTFAVREANFSEAGCAASENDRVSTPPGRTAFTLSQSVKTH